ncbi:MAG: purine-nucleoside phosphorylase [Propionibacteriaceae bacterium]|jgi:purine-nucleoside phosphorylase|nr:purine-nucleoside phosphorylase [Propionibacteriaceae bacterium]
MILDANNYLEVADTAAAEIRRRAGVEGVDIALVLGSGWSGGVDKLGSIIATIPLEELSGFSRPVVAGHGGNAIITEVAGRNVLVYTGRTHFYEGRGTDAVAHGVRTAAALGAQVFVVTNGCGGLDTSWKPGQVVVLRDHINLTAATPLHGPTFIDLSAAYDPELRALVHDIDPTLPEGVYAQFTGPAYETPAEVRMAGIMGATLVGMSTALEVIAARAANLRVLGLSLMTNLAAGVSPNKLDHAEVIAAGREAAPRLATLLAQVTQRIATTIDFDTPRPS